ncbi:uncharacterized protein LOC120256711 [Dioscorea cayenensis subsp. rotundata]|uniref:Uncharacterized protein LOC120256711 n=1 Tax=Dioscorea cayennensis subsp. rotundata TaxID=55577 RepID=A0AB40AZT8_DIOCR|nr:uncharacterized protein LOC120256711 [Dioscorea cayenensis subsp. rotundata]XP_039120332.1 uncharacterized protein LOC120256711 [Dioscorea cayenensis subsp. rotundata]
MEQALLAGVATKIGETLAEETMKKKSASSKQDEVQLLSQIHSSMERIKSEFEVMQAFLNRVDKQRDEVTEAWLKRVRDVASQVEKVVDEFAKIVRGPSKKLSKALLETFKYNSWDPLVSHVKDRRNTVNNFCNNLWTTNLSGLNQIAAQLKTIEADLDHILKMKIRWEVTTMNS